MHGRRLTPGHEAPPAVPEYRQTVTHVPALHVLPMSPDRTRMTLTNRWSARVGNKAPSPYSSARGAQLNRRCHVNVVRKPLRSASALGIRRARNAAVSAVHVAMRCCESAGYCVTSTVERVHEMRSCCSRAVATRSARRRMLSLDVQRSARAADDHGASDCDQAMYDALDDASRSPAAVVGSETRLRCDARVA